MQSYWIWNKGDYEIFHVNQVNSRRQEYGVDIPPFFKMYDVERNVRIYSEFNIKQDGYLKLFLNGYGHIFVDDVRYDKECKINISKGLHKFMICVFNLVGLPSAYIESDVCATDASWYTLENGKKINVGFETFYDSPNSCPEEFPFAYERKKPISVLEKNSGILYDFGKELFGYLYINGANKNQNIHVSYGESMEEALDVDNSILFENIAGSENYKLRQRAFRYIYLTGTNNVTVEADLEYIPLPYLGSFKCDNDVVNRIWEVCAYTLHLNMREVLTEAIKRDRWLWAGDAYQAFRFNKYIFFDKDTERRSLIALRGKDPVTEPVNNITDFSFYWIISLYEYYKAYGDVDFLKFIYPRAVSLMKFYDSRKNDEGFIIGKYNDWVFLDWADIDKDGAVCAEQMLYIQANRTMKEIAKTLGEDYQKYEQTEKILCKKINTFFWNEEKGAYIDCYESGKNHITRHANIFAIMFDICSERQKMKIIDNVLKNDNIEKITTPYFEGYELDVMGMIGDCSYIENMLMTHWKGMLDNGATTIWEEYNPKMEGIEHYAMYGNKFGKSLCHAWGASPIYLLGKYYLGVSATSPGFETFEVSPELGGFKEIEGSVPVKDGIVYVHMNQNEVKVKATRDGGILKIWGKEVKLQKDKEEIVKATYTQ